MKKILIFSLSLVMIITLAGCAEMEAMMGDLFGAHRPTHSISEEQDEFLDVTEATDPTVETTEPPRISEDNPYYSCYVKHNGFVLPGSDTTYYTCPDVEDMTDLEREVAREEIYARHGRSFADPDLQEYFEAQDWYTAGSETKLNSCEEDNLFMLDVYEKQKSGDIRSNRYIRFMTNSNNYAIGDSNQRHLGAADLSMLEHDHLVIIRNEIYARRGFIFDSDTLKTYFYCTKWYRPNPNFTKKDFNDFEVNNITMCNLYEKKLEGVKFSSDNPYKYYYYGKDTTFFPHSSTSYLEDTNWEDLWSMTKEELRLVRSEILARNGYTFEGKHLQEYFLQFDWYKPNTVPGSKDGLNLSVIEESNIELIKEIEQYI